MKLLNEERAPGKIISFILNDRTNMPLDPNKPSARIFESKNYDKVVSALNDIEANHNHSWYRELKLRSEKNPSRLALFYRGTKISFSQMFDYADSLAKYLYDSGVRFGDSVSCCVENTPEFVYLLLALNKIGAKICPFGDNYTKPYINDILSQSTKKIFIGSDYVYGKIRSEVDAHNFDKVLLFSRTDSLPENPEICEGYVEELDEYYRYKNKVSEFKSLNNKIVSFSEAMESAKESNTIVEDKGDLNTPFLSTFTSGSTQKGHPSQMIHTNRSLIVSGRFHDSELSGNPDIENIRGLAHIHTDTNTDIITCISDNLMQLWNVAMEVEYGKQHSLNVLFLNRPNYVNMTRTQIIAAAKEYLFNKDLKIKNKLIGFLFCLFSVGEGTSRGEEKLINKFLRKGKAGHDIKINGLSLPYTTCCTGGADTEHGGLFYTLWKSLFEKMYAFKLMGSSLGLKPQQFVQTTALKMCNGKWVECDYDEPGIIVANSATTMQEYLGDYEKTKGIIITDDWGRDWVTCNVVGHIDKMGYVHILGRENNKVKVNEYNIKGEKVHKHEYCVLPHVIEELICKDSKNVLSCSVVSYSTTDDFGFDVSVPVINVEFQPEKQKSDEEIIKSIISRCAKYLPQVIVDSFHFRIIDNEKSFPEAHSGKRSITDLKNLELKDTFNYCNSNKEEFVLTRKKVA